MVGLITNGFVVPTSTVPSDHEKLVGAAVVETAKMNFGRAEFVPEVVPLVAAQEVAALDPSDL